MCLGWSETSIEKFLNDNELKNNKLTEMTKKLLKDCQNDIRETNQVVLRTRIS